jgi:hypothetical protein
MGQKPEEMTAFLNHILLPGSPELPQALPWIPRPSMGGLRKGRGLLWLDRVRGERVEAGLRELQMVNILKSGLLSVST